MEFSTLVHFSKVVSDSSTAEGIASLLGKTVVDECDVSHTLVFGTSNNGDFKLLASYGACDSAGWSQIDLEGLGSVAELRIAATRTFENGNYTTRAFPLISESGLFGALIVLYRESHPPAAAQWTLMEGLTELTAISLSKSYQHQKLQKAFDDLRASQDAFVKTEKLRALGEMSAGIAHDLKNLLSPLQLYNDEIRDSAGTSEEVIELTERIERVLNRGLETVERLRDFSRQSPDNEEDQCVNLNSLIREALEISKPRLGHIHCSLQLGEPPLVRLRESDCITAIVNLLLNSADALDGKGTIIARTGESDGGAFVEVEDNGPGIPPEIKERILEPFFTTKGDRGTGLGVSLVYAFTQRYKGRLEIDSELGKGARFRMWFPPG